MSVTTKQITQNKLSIGGLAKFFNPKMRKYFQKKENGLVFFDENIISSQLDNAKKKIGKYISEKKNVLIVSQQSLYAEEIANISKKSGIYYMNSKVPAGFLTNFSTLIQSVKKMNKLQKFIQSDKFVKLSKKEQSSMEKELKKIERLYLGVSGLKDLPDLVIVVGGTLMNGVIKEIKQVGIDNIVLASSDFDKRWDENSLVVLNTNSYKSVMFALHTIFGQ